VLHADKFKLPTQQDRLDGERRKIMITVQAGKPMTVKEMRCPAETRGTFSFCIQVLTSDAIACPTEATRSQRPMVMENGLR
jgi:hypothetical protein